MRRKRRVTPRFQRMQQGRNRVPAANSRQGCGPGGESLGGNRSFVACYVGRINTNDPVSASTRSLWNRSGPIHFRNEAQWLGTPFRKFTANEVSAT
jgi:hypothetical protein